MLFFLIISEYAYGVVGLLNRRSQNLLWHVFALVIYNTHSGIIRLKTDALLYRERLSAAKV